MNLRSTIVPGLIIILLAVAVEEGSQARDTRAAEGASYEKEIQGWRAKRLEEITGEGGWRSLVGLFWLKPGQNRFGSDPSNHIVLPKNRAPKFAGSLWLDKAGVRLKAKPQVDITNNGKPVSDIELQSDVDGKQTILRLGSLTLYVIKRGEKLGLRVKDSQNPARFHFAGLDYFPVDQKWRIEARLDLSVPPKSIAIVNVLGMVENMSSPGVIVFNLAGRSYRLEPVIEKGETQLFIIFGDKTTGKETYGAGRYLYADPPGADGKVMLDFNKAYNPPCAFTRFATCPLPPRQNRLPLRVEAGEMKYAGSEH